MSGTRIRHIGLLVVIGAVLVPHWVTWLRPAGHDPLSFVVGLTIAVALVAGWAVARNREEIE